MDIILVHMGGDVPDYYWECVRQIRKFTKDRIIAVVPDDAIFNHLMTDNVMMVKCLPKTRNWRRFIGCDFFGSSQDLWQYSCERFYAIESAMKQLDIKKALHIENDNLIYADPSAVGFEDRYGNGIALTPINENLLSAGIMYIGSQEAIESQNNRMNHVIMLGRQELVKQYGDEMLNEMRLLKILNTIHEGSISALPIFPGADFAFDCASWGQWVGGAHHHGEEPFATKNHFIGREILNGKYDVEWAVESGLRIPYAVSVKTGVKSRLFNLHIHNKTLRKWRS